MGSCEEGRLLLAAANRDLTALHGMTDPRVFADEIFGFHAQQAAEKALKAWLCMLDVEYPRTYDLTLLLALLDVEGQDISPFLDIVELNPYAVQYRYEAFDDIGCPGDRSTVIGRVENLVTAVTLLVGPDR